MRPVEAWVLGEAVRLDAHTESDHPSEPRPTALAEAVASCNNARLDVQGEAAGDPTEVALLAAARSLGADVDPTAGRNTARTSTTSIRSSSS